MHVSPLTRVAVAAGAALVSLVDPSRADMVALLGELTGGPALTRIRDRMAGSPSGARILAQRPRVTSALLAAPYPAGSFGAAYAAYMSHHAFEPEARHEVRFVADPELRYVLQRYREVHDFWHTLAGLPATVTCELAVKWLEALQTGLPMPALGALVGPLRLHPAKRATLLRHYVPWAVGVARDAEYLMAVEYEAMLGLPLEDVRAALRFPAAPRPGGLR